MITVTMEGEQEIMLRLDGLKPAMVRSWGRTGITKACRIMAREAKRKCPVETGALKASIGFRIRTYPKHNPTIVVGVIGPKRDTKKTISEGKAKFRVGVIEIKRGKRKGKFRKLRKKERGKVTPDAYRNPANYAHLVEKGHRIAVGGTLGNRIYAPTRTTTVSQVKGRTRLIVTGVRGKGRLGFQKTVEWAKVFAPSSPAGRTKSGYVKGKPFMRPAFDANKATMKRLIMQEIQTGMAKYAAKQVEAAGEAG